MSRISVPPCYTKVSRRPGAALTRMIYVLTILHVLCCLILIAVVLLQSGKAADLAGAFGGMGSQTAFGPRGAATVLTKATTIAAGLFMITSLTLSVMASRGGSAGGSTVLEKTAPAKAPVTKSSTPAPAGSAPVQIQVPGGGGPVTIPTAPAQAPITPAPPAKK